MKWLQTLLSGRGGKPAWASVAAVQREAGDVCMLRVGGVLSKQALDRIQALAAQVVARGAKDLKVLLILNDVQGWKRGDDRRERDSSARNLARNAKIAVVGDARWQSPTLTFLAAGHRAGEVCYFTPEQEPQARAWLAR